MEAVNLRIRKICDHLFRDSGKTRLFVNLEHKKVNKATRNIYTLNEVLKRKDKIELLSRIYTCRVHHIKYRAKEICNVRGKIRNVNEIILRT